VTYINNPEFRAKQQQVLDRMRMTMAGMEMMRSRSQISLADAAAMETAYERYWDRSMLLIPAGWATILGDFLHEMDGLGDLVDSVSVRVEVTPSGLKAYVFPEMSRWHPHQVADLRAAQRQLYGLSQQTCEKCAQPGGPVPFGDRASFFLCAECADKARADIDVVTERFRRRVDVYREFQELWVPSFGKIELGVAEDLDDILMKGLRDIKAKVSEHELLGHVHVTHVEDHNGLLVRVRYRDRALHNQIALIEINSIVDYIHWQSDRIVEARYRFEEAENDG
jgi:hypothetical protein